MHSLRRFLLILREVSVVESPPGDARVRVVLGVTSKIISFQETSQPAVLFRVESPKRVWSIEISCPFIWSMREVGSIVEQQKSRGEASNSHEQEKPE